MRTTATKTQCERLNMRAGRTGRLFVLGILLAALAIASGQAWAEVVTYPAPPGETLSADCEVSVAGQKVDVYTARVLDPPFAGKEWDFGGPYSFANFDFSGSVVVRIVSKRSLANVVIRPESFRIKPTKSFLCRGDTGVTQFVDSTVDLTDLFDFGTEPAKHCSYTYHDPYPGTAGTGFPLTTSSDPGMAVAGDLSPWFARPERPAYVFPNKTTAYPNGFKPLPPASREEIKLGNSWAHQDDGQNILFADGHTNFEKTSACGVNEDNVYTIGDNPMGTVGAPGVAAPASRTDSWLVSDGTGAPKGTRCFPADTIVWVDGEMTQISKVVAGAMVDKPAVTKTIMSLQKTVCSNEIEELVVHDDGASWERYDISLENGNSLVVADSHYFLLASGEWVSSLKLEAGSKLQTLEGAVTIKSVVKSATPSTGTVYNLKIKGGDRYLVGKDGIVVRDW